MSIINSILNYFRASWEEAKKVSWPSRKDTVRFSALVIGVSLFTAIFFASLDAGFSHIVDLSIALKSKIGQSAPTPTPSQPVTPTTQQTPVLDVTATTSTN